jgi:hypothetical protein
MKKKENFSMFSIIFLMGSIILFAMSMDDFYIGIKNIDWGWNMQEKSFIDGTTYYDTGSDGIQRSPTDAYFLGMLQIRRGFQELLISGIFSIFNILILMNRRKDE